MRILEYSIGVVLFYGLFRLGRVMVREDEHWSRTLAHDVRKTTTLRKVFHHGGIVLQWLASVAGFVDAVAVLVLVTGYLSELAL